MHMPVYVCAHAWTIHVGVLAWMCLHVCGEQQHLGLTQFYSTQPICSDEETKPIEVWREISENLLFQPESGKACFRVQRLVAEGGFLGPLLPESVLSCLQSPLRPSFLENTFLGLSFSILLNLHGPSSSQPSWPFFSFNMIFHPTLSSELSVNSEHV